MAEFTKKDTAILITRITMHYPNTFKNYDKDKIKLMIESWHEYLKDLEKNVVVASYKKYVATNTSGFAPNIADIRKNAVIVAEGEKIEAIEAWELVMKRVRKYGTYQEKEAIESMDDFSAKVTKMIGYKDLCLCPLDTIGVIKGQFIKAYNSLRDREQEHKQLTPDILSLINKNKKLASNQEIKKIEYKADVKQIKINKKINPMEHIKNILNIKVV